MYYIIADIAEGAFYGDRPFLGNHFFTLSIRKNLYGDGSRGSYTELSTYVCMQSFFFWLNTAAFSLSVSQTSPSNWFVTFAK